MSVNSIIEKYYIVIVSEAGQMPAMYRDEAGGGLVAAAMMDLLLQGVVTVEKKKIIVEKPLPEALSFLQSLYAFLTEKPRTILNLLNGMSAYGDSGRRIRTLTADVGKALLAGGLATKQAGGIFGPKIVYIPDPTEKERVIGELKAVLRNMKEASPADAVLLFILAESKNLNKHFSKEEITEVKRIIKELKENPESKELAGMINYVSNIETILFMLVVFGII